MRNGKGSKPDKDKAILLAGTRIDDILFIDVLDISIDEKRMGGIDPVFARVDYTLDANVENLTLTGGSNFSGTGNDLGDTIYGNDGVNVLSGGGVEALSFADATLIVGDIAALVPDAPVAVADYLVTSEDTQIVLAVLSNDLGEGLRIASVSQGVSCSVTINADGTISYTQAPSTTGADNFSYTIEDAFGRMASAAVEIDVLAANVAPEAVGDVFSMMAGTVLTSTISILDNDSDPDGDPLIIIEDGSTNANGGSVQVSTDGTFSYTAASGFTGIDAFDYAVAHGRGGKSVATVTIEGVDMLIEEPPYYVTGMRLGDAYRMNAGDPVGMSVAATFVFAETAPDYYYDESFAWTGFEVFSADMQAIIRAALSNISNFAGVTFVETSVEEAGIVFGIADIPGIGRRLAYYPDAYNTGTPAGDVWIDSALPGLSFAPGTLDFKTLLHEFGHALGLQYADLPGTELNWQYTATAGDDVYTYGVLSETSKTIWEADRRDTLDLSDATHGVDIDIRAGAFRTVSGTGTATSRSPMLR